MSTESGHLLQQRLHGTEGDLLLLSVAVEPRSLEALLDVLARLDFPVNPQLYHRSAKSIVEFPAYAQRIEDVREALGRNGFNPQALVAAGFDGETVGTSS